MAELLSDVSILIEAPVFGFGQDFHMLVLLCLFQHGLGDVDFLQVHGVLDMHDSRMLSVNVIAGAQCDLDTALITVGEQRNLRGTQYGGGDHVGVGTVYIDFIYRTLGGYTVSYTHLDVYKRQVP